MSDNTAGERIPGEGETKTVRRVRERISCGYCGEPADQKHTYLLPEARHNPASSGYSGDDISWCSDHDEFTCKACRDREWRGQEPYVSGYRHCATFYNMKSMPHLFLHWVDYEIPTPAVKPDKGQNSALADETK